MLNLALRKKRMKELQIHCSRKNKKNANLLFLEPKDMNKTTVAIASEDLMEDSEPQIPFLIDYEELTMFSSKKSI